MEADVQDPLKEVIRLFLKLGLTSFGGPAAHIAMMHEEVVNRRKWLTDPEFLDLLGAVNLIPGPNSTEMAIHLGYLRAGFPGLVFAGLAFILPAVFIVLLISRFFAQYGALPQVAWLLYGVKPVVIAIIIQALANLAAKAANSPLKKVILISAVSGYFFGINELLLLFCGGAVMIVGSNWIRIVNLIKRNACLPWVSFLNLHINQFAYSTENGVPFSLGLLFFIFLKIGSILYGSGYVLIAFLQSDLVNRYAWLTQSQLINAVAIGQITPGPLFTTATFIGYQLGGLPGAALATIGIFLPAFLLVAVSNPLIPRFRQSALLSSLLDGINAASLGLMGAAAWQLGVNSIQDPLTGIIAISSLVLLLYFKINSTWLILGGSIIGIARYFLA